MAVHVEYKLNNERIAASNHPCTTLRKLKEALPQYSDRLSAVTCKTCRAWIESRPAIWNALRTADIEAGTAQDLAVLAEDARRRHLEKVARAEANKRKRREARIAAKQARQAVR